MTLVLSVRLDGDASGLTASAKLSREELENLKKTLGDTEAAARGAAGGLDAADAGVKGVGAGAGTAAPNVDRLAQEFDQLKGRLDPAHAALRRYEQEQLLVNQAVAAGAVSQQEAARIVALSTRQYVTAASGGVSGFRSVGMAAQQAGYQVGDFAVQVASGGNAVVAGVQQLSQLLGFFGAFGAVAGAALAIAGGLYLGFSRLGESADLAEEAQKRLADALKAGRDEAELAAMAENILAEALERGQESSAELTDLSFTRVTALREQQLEALNAAKAERDLTKAQLESAIAEERRKIAIASGGTQRTNRLTGDTFKVEDNPEIREQQKEVERLQKGIEALEARIRRLNGAQDDAFGRDFTGPLQAQIDHQKALAAAYGVSAEAVEEAVVKEKIRQEQVRAGVEADSDRGREIARMVREREREAKVVADLAKAERERTAEAERDGEERKRLAAQRVTTIEGLQDELRYQQELTGAHLLGEEAILAVEAARKAELIVQKLKLEGTEVEVGLIEELVLRIEQQRKATEDIVDAQKEAERTAKELAREQKKAAEEVSRTIERIADNAQEKLGDILYDHLRNEHVDFLEFFKDTFLRTVADVAAAILRNQFIIPIATQVVGAAPGLFGLDGAAAQIAQQQAGGLFSGNSPFSGITNLLGGGPGGGLYNQFAFSSLGQSLGLSMSSGAIAASSFGVTAATPAATLALSGPAGGFGSLAGISTASTGGLVGAAGAGGAAPALTALGAVAPYLLAAAAIALPLLGGMLGGNPSVGPVGIADFAPGLGRGREFDQPLIDAFTADNGGDPDSMRPIAEAIADIIADSADRFGATVDHRLRFRVANYVSPEGGSGRSQGFEVNAFLEDQIEQRIAEGLSQEQAIYEALRFAVTEAFEFDNQALTDAVQNLTADTTEELLGQLQTALDFDEMITAIRDNSDAINANTVAEQEAIIAIRRQGEERGRALADVTRERFKTLSELFTAPEELSGLGRNATPQAIPAELTAGLDALRLLPPDFDRGALRGGAGLVAYDQDNQTITARDQSFTLRSTGLEGDEGLQLIDDAGEVVGTFRTLSEALVAAAESAVETAAAMGEVDDATRELYDRNLGRIRDAIEVTRADVDRDIGRITGSFEDPEIGPAQRRLIEGDAALEAYGDQLEAVNDAFRRQAEIFPELADEISDWLIDIPATLATAREELWDNIAQDYVDDLNKEHRQLRGFGAVDTVRDLVDARDDRLTDVAGLDVDVSLIHRNFKTAVENAFEGLDIEVLREIKENVTDPVVQGLADKAIADKVATFNRSIDDQLLSLESPLTAQLVALNRQYQADLKFANDNGGNVDSVMRLYQEQAKRLVEGTDDLEMALTESVNAYTRILPDLKQFRYELRTDPALATETTEERYALIKERFDEIAEAAAAGDVDAQAQLEAAGRDLLEVSRLVNAANDNYAADRRLVMTAVDASIAKADSELQIAKDQLSALNGIDARLVELAQALSSGQFGNQPTSNLILAQASGYAGPFGDGAFQQAAQSYAASNVQSLGNRPDINAQLAFVTGFTGAFGGGGSGPSFQEHVRSSAVSEIQREAARILLRGIGEEPGFVDGGHVGGGLVMNGVRGRDSVIARLARDEFVVKGPSVAAIGVPALTYINETGRLPGSDGGSMLEVGRSIVAALHSEGDASRAQSRDDADHVAEQVGRLRQTIAPVVQSAAHERARVGRAA